MERIASGYQLAEAPLATDDGGVIFSDILGGGVRRWWPGTDEITIVVPRRRGVGGIVRHADGGLVVSGRDVSHIGIDLSAPPSAAAAAEGGGGGGGEARADRPATRTLFGAEGIAGINDLTVDPDGHVIVGLLHFRPFAGQSPVPGEYVRLESDGTTTLVMDGILWANGCAFSPDGGTFYGCDYHRGLVLACERRDDGTYTPSRIAAVSPSGQADGMAVDETGALWVALGSKGTIGRFRPDGQLDSELEVPARFVSSLCFGGRDGRDLFVTTPDTTEDPRLEGCVFHTRVDVAGLPLLPAVI
jgi:gluconolactonase